MRKRTLVSPTRLGYALRVCVAFGMLVGCGDAHVFRTSPGSIDPSSGPRGHACFDGAVIKLARYSSQCDQTTKSVESEVQAGMVFSSEEVASLGAPCENEPAPALEVVFDTDTHSILVDFSHVSQGDRFPAADFDGYMFEVVLEDTNGILIAVMVDQEASSLDFDSSDLEFGPAYIDMNFEGVAYDEGGLVKLDLVFAHASPIQNNETPK
jgi:hypothetical protein